jgi:hypothetical protein
MWGIISLARTRAVAHAAMVFAKSALPGSRVSSPMEGDVRFGSSPAHKPSGHVEVFGPLIAPASQANRAWMLPAAHVVIPRAERWRHSGWGCGQGFVRANDTSPFSSPRVCPDHHRASSGRIELLRGYRRIACRRNHTKGSYP